MSFIKYVYLFIFLSLSFWRADVFNFDEVQLYFFYRSAFFKKAILLVKEWCMYIGAFITFPKWYWVTAAFSCFLVFLTNNEKTTYLYFCPRTFRMYYKSCVNGFVFILRLQWKNNKYFHPRSVQDIFLKNKYELDWDAQYVYTLKRMPNANPIIIRNCS